MGTNGRNWVQVLIVSIVWAHIRAHDFASNITVVSVLYFDYTHDTAVISCLLGVV